MNNLTEIRTLHAQAIAEAGGIEKAIESKFLPRVIDTTLSEAIVLGLLRQNVHVFFSVFGHGSTEVAEVLRIYEQFKLIKTLNVRSEIEASHAAAALRWVTGEKAAVITSIGPGALQAMAASIVSASDGLGIWYLFGDETTEDEGLNMQQIPKHQQHGFLQLCSTMGNSYTLDTPYAISTALRRGMNTVDHPFRQGPFYLLLPMNTQATSLPSFNLDELPTHLQTILPAAAGDELYAEAAKAIWQGQQVVVRVGGGARNAGREIGELLELADAVAVHSPLCPGVVAYSNPRNMTVGGSKGSLSGNFAMENADLLIAIGTRFVCQSDCSRTGYPHVQKVININPEIEAATHYAHTTCLIGDAAKTLSILNKQLRTLGPKVISAESDWYQTCKQKRQQWIEFKQKRYQKPILFDPMWNREVLTQPGAIHTALEWAKNKEVISFFDAGDVQANGFQIVEDEQPGRTYTETGASYMGFSVSALLASAAAEEPFYGLSFSGDGSFTMCPQILIDGVQHGAQGCVLLFDNRRMAAISGLQLAQYRHDYCTNDSVEIDYVKWAGSIHGVMALHGGYDPQSLQESLDKAFTHKGISVIYIPVYYGPDDLGGMGVFGRWNVGNWCQETQSLRHKIGL